MEAGTERHLIIFQNVEEQIQFFKNQLAAIDKHFISYIFFFLFLYSNVDFIQYANKQRNLRDTQTLCVTHGSHPF